MDPNIKYREFLYICSSIFIAFLPQSLMANDSSAALSTGGIILEQNDDIIMLSEKLHLSPTKVRVEYEYFNDGDLDQDLLVAFALPQREKLVEVMGYSIAVPSYLDFQTWIDGENTKLLEGHRYWELEDRTQQLLKNLNSDMEYYLALRQQNFPSNEVTKVVHEYTPAVGGGIPYYNYKTMKDALLEISSNEASRKEHGHFLNCTDVNDALNNLEDWIEFMQNEKSLDPSDEENYWQYLVRYSTLGYILKTGKNWKGPIKNFELKVTADFPFFLNTCFPGLERTSETSYEFKATDYVPEKNIYLMFHKSIDWDRFKLLK